MTNDVVLVTVDALRADHVGHLSDRDVTPNVDDLAADGVTCERAYANGIPTYFAFRSILGGRRDVAGTAPIGLPEAWRTVADVFSEHGYATAAFNAANPWLTPEYNYDSGFDAFVDYLDRESGDGLSDRVVERMTAVQNRVPDGRLRDVLGLAARTYCSLTGSYPIEAATAVTDRALEWLSARTGDEPVFLWVHYMDPHYPWTPRSESVSTWEVARTWHDVAHVYNDSNRDPDERTIADAKALYGEEVRRVDDEVGRLLDAVTARETEREPVVCLTADHGTELGDRGGFSHGPVSLYEETVRVPLVVAGPNVPRKTVSDVVQHSDVPRTLVRLAAFADADETVEVETGWTGASLLTDRSDGALIQVRYGYDPASGPETDAGLLSAFVEYPWKLHWNEERGTVELYDLENDPGERVDRSESRPETTDRLQSAIREERAAIARERRTAREILDVRRRAARVELP